LREVVLFVEWDERRMEFRPFVRTEAGKVGVGAFLLDTLPGQYVFHKNRNLLDCRRENLICRALGDEEPIAKKKPRRKPKAQRTIRKDEVRKLLAEEDEAKKLEVVRPERVEAVVKKVPGLGGHTDWFQKLPLIERKIAEKKMREKGG